MLVDVNREVDRLIRAEQHDPFQVLGFHRIAEEPPTAVVRTFQPQAAEVGLILKGKRLAMYKMREEGVFEAVLPTCGEPPDYLFEVKLPDGSLTCCRDPYRFGPQLTDYDRYLFNNGTHYEIYNRMGSHLLVIDQVEGTIFRVWAPNARRVSVLGNFNYWDGRLHQMRCLGTSGIWELFIPGLGEGEAYKYEICTQEGAVLEKADPFQFCAELRPKSGSIVWNLDTYGWRDHAWLANRRRVGGVDRPLSIYQVHAGSWQRDPAEPGRLLGFRELADTLIPYVKNMGFTHLELLPIMEHPRDESWGFQSTGYYAVSSRYGTPQDFMYFVDCCHRQSIGVILDWVPSRFPVDGHSLGMFDGTALYEGASFQSGRSHDTETMFFNYGRREVANFLIANALFWLDKFHLDGLRIDSVAAMLYLDYARPAGDWVPNFHGSRENLAAIEFLKHLNSIMAERFPDAVMIAEESTTYFGVTKRVEEGGLGFRYKWNTGWKNDTLHYFSRAPLFRKYHHSGLTFSSQYAFTENFILPLAHDEVVHGKGSLLARMPGDLWQRFANLRLLFFFLWTHPGKKLLFMGNEFGQLSEWYCKVSLDWHLIEQDGRHRQMQDFVETLNRLYRQHPALWELDGSQQGFAWLGGGSVEQSIIAYARFGQDPKEHLVCLLNATPGVYYDYALEVPAGVPYREILCTDEEQFGGTSACNPHVKKPLAQPDGQGPFHVKISVPPLAGIIFKPAGAEEAPSEGASGEGGADLTLSP